MAAEIQDAVAATDAHDEAALGEDHAHRPGFGLHRRREAACEQRKKGSAKESDQIVSHGCFSNVVTSVRRRTRCIEGDHHPGDVGGYFEAALGALQGDSDALVVLELYAADAANHGSASADHAIAAGEIAQLVDVVGSAD